MNSLSMPWMMAGLALIANDVSSAEDVDKTWMICLKALGPCAMLDIVGLEAMYHVAAY
jgi:3-hydroxyacyl-CoA dehydrogenase